MSFLFSNFKDLLGEEFIRFGFGSYETTEEREFKLQIKSCFLLTHLYFTILDVSLNI